MTDPMQVDFSAAQIDAKVSELAARIEHDRQGRPIVLLVVLKGAILFAADLMRRLQGEVLLDFFVVSSYAGDRSPSGEAQVLHAPRTDLAGRHVILGDEIVDTGVTVTALVEHLKRSGAASVRVCTLLDKVAARQVPVTLNYVGFVAPSVWLVGYGMDSDGLGRNLPDIYGVSAPE
jgi:hypoxanthine phosphoribosyltransferase